MFEHIVKDIAVTVKESVQAGIKLLSEKFEQRFADLETRIGTLPTPEKGEKGDSLTLDDVRPVLEDAFIMAAKQLKAPEVNYDEVKSFIAEQVEKIPAGQDGKSVTLEELKPLVEETVEKVAQSLRAPEVDYEKVQSFINELAANIPVPQDGKSVTTEELQPYIDEAAEKAVRGMMPKEAEKEEIKSFISQEIEKRPTPRDGIDGKSVSVEELRPMVKEVIGEQITQIQPQEVDYGRVEGIISEKVAQIPVAKDGQDGKSVTVEELRPIVEETVAKAVEPLVPAEVDYEKVEGIISEKFAQLPVAKDGQDGKSVTLEDVRPLVEEAVEKVAQNITLPEVDYDSLKSFITEEVSKIPPGKDGESVGIDDVRPLVEEAIKEVADGLKAPEVDYDQVKSLVKEEVASIPPPQDGKSVTLDQVKPLLKEMVDAIEIPVPEKGEKGDSVALDEVKPILEVLVKDAMEAMPTAKDGAPGKDADPVDMSAVAKMIDAAVDKAVGQAVAKIHIPVPVPAQDGRDALDIEILPEIDPDKSYPRGAYAIHKGGLWRSHERTKGMRGWETVVDGIADIQIEYDGERAVKIVTEKSSGEVVAKDFLIPIVIDRGVFKEGQAYAKNDGITFAGSFWIAQKDAPQGKPGDGNSDYRLAVKRGRDANPKVKVGT